jgi:hypothetical protein
LLSSNSDKKRAFRKMDLTLAEKENQSEEEKLKQVREKRLKSEHYIKKVFTSTLIRVGQISPFKTRFWYVSTLFKKVTNE